MQLPITVGYSSAKCISMIWLGSYRISRHGYLQRHLKWQCRGFSPAEDVGKAIILITDAENHVWWCCRGSTHGCRKRHTGRCYKHGREAKGVPIESIHPNQISFEITRTDSPYIYQPEACEDIAPAQKVVPPYEQAIINLEKLRNSNLIERGHIKGILHRGLLTYYVNIWWGRYTIYAMEMTSSQILDAIKQHPEASQAKSDLKAIIPCRRFRKICKSIASARWQYKIIQCCQAICRRNTSSHTWGNIRNRQ